MAWELCAAFCAARVVVAGQQGELTPPGQVGRRKAHYALACGPAAKYLIHPVHSREEDLQSLPSGDRETKSSAAIPLGLLAIGAGLLLFTA
jgi:hypothetical protein